MPPRPPQPPSLPSRPALVRMLDEAFRGPAWHGPSLMVALKVVSAERAVWRPGPGRPNIWEQALHCAIGKHLVADRLLPAGRGRFPRSRTSSWWAPSPEIADAAERERRWHDDLVLLDECHQRLLDRLRRIPLSRLRERQAGRRQVLGEQVVGMALHDAYHAGQVALIARLAESAER